MRNKIITVFFCLLLLLGAVTMFAMPDKYYSETEKRTLTQLPEISFANFKSGKLGKELEKYLADQFPGRNGWVTAKTISERILGKKENNGVYFGKDNYLIEIHKTLNTKQGLTNREALKRLSAELEKKNIQVKLMLVPTSSEILSNKLPYLAPSVNQTEFIELAKKCGLDVVDVTGALKEHKEEYIYYKTDHHWTSLGAYYAYAEWMKAKGENAEPIEAWTKEVLCNNFRGTTYAKVNDPFAEYDIIEAYYKSKSHEVNYNGGNYITNTIYERKFLNGSDQYAVFFNSNQATTVVKGSGNGKLLILKDSYANSFAQFAIDQYEETHIIDPRFYKSSINEYVIENNITEVLVLYNIPNFTEDLRMQTIDR